MPAAAARSHAINWIAACLLALVCFTAPIAKAAAPDAAAYQRSLELPEQWQHLTRGIAGPVSWIDDSRYRYRRTVEGGFEFLLRHVDETDARPAFDHAGLARALGEALDQPYDARRLPLDDYEFIDGEAAIRFRATDHAMPQWMRCELGAAMTCTTTARESGKRRPRAFGVVRDLSVPADDTPHPSPDGNFEAFVQDGNVALRIRADGSVRLLTSDGAADDFYDAETIAWSPDSSRFALYRVRPGHQRLVTRVESSPRDQLQPKVHTQLYPKPGDAVDIERPVIFEIATGRRIEVPTALFTNPFRLSPLAFRADGRSLAFRFIERGHQRVRLIEVDAHSGSGRTVAEEQADTFVNDWWHRSFFHDVGSEGREIVWMSERDGWNHLYMIDGTSGQARQLTRGEWVVREVLRVDEERREIWFAGNGREPGDPYLRHVYRIDFDGANLTHMTPAHGWHETSLSPDGRYYVDTWSRLDQPDVTELRDARDGSLLARIEEGDASALLSAGYRPPETFVAPGRDGHTQIWGLVVRPTDYDSGRSYPVIENIYAGPHNASVQKKFWPYDPQSSNERLVRAQALADLGFIVVQIDGMGTMYRSKAFHDVAWKNLQDGGFPDRIAWHRALAARDPSYDISRGVGIYGASAGAQNALHALLFHPGFYTVAVAYNGCYDNRMDKISWNEQWMGWPVDDSYARASGVDNAHLLQGRLLLVVGEQDANVDPASTYQVADALIRAGKDFDLVTMPGAGHGVGRSEEPVNWLQRRKFDFFVRHLLGQPTPDWNRPRAVGPLPADPLPADPL
ncbi:DPP IV N-terminal domain-containing protein [Luteimonas sp. A277]